MRRYIPVLKEYGFWNLAACLLQITAPLAWTSPFALAFLTAAGYGGLSLLQVLPGAVLGAALGAGGFGAAAGGILAYAVSGFVRERDSGSARAVLAALALGLCLVSSLSFHIAGGAYDVISCIVSAIAAMAACPVLVPFVNRMMEGRMSLDAEQSVAFFLLTSLMLSGCMRLFAPLGYMLVGFFALWMGLGGIFPALAGALAGCISLVFAGAGGAEIAVLLLSSAFSGAMGMRGATVQAAMFLLGIPLSMYFGVERESLFLFASAAVYPWIPRGCRACFLRYLGLFRDQPMRYLSAICARLHMPQAGQRVCGDTGCTETFENGRMLFMLADGMGTGEAARRVSSRALQYAREIFRAALAPQDAVKCVNALCRGTGGEVHTTLDACLLDLITGRAHFVKSGAEPAWVVGKAGAVRVEGEALPLGVLADAPGHVKSAMLVPGDMIFMATDGLIWALGGAEKAEKELLQLNALAPGEVCAEMMKKALAHARRERRDDMSCLCVCVYAKCGFRPGGRFLMTGGNEKRKAG